MIIGLYDNDFELNRIRFSMDLMKLSTYYKRKGEIVKLSPLFAPEKYTKFIFSKHNPDGNFPINLHKFNNIEYYGNAFHPNKTIVLPHEIETLRPDTSIYNIYQNKITTESGRSLFK